MWLEKCTFQMTNFCFDTLTKISASIKHYNRFLNQDYDWYQSYLSTARPVARPGFRLTTDMVYDSVKKIKSGKEAGSPGVGSEMLIADGEMCTKVAC